MIIVRMLGGLGNQMFQHALGTMLARVHRCELLWDLSDYEHLKSRRPFELKRVFDLNTQVASDAVLRSVLGWRGNRAVKVMLDRPYLALARPKSYIAEPHFQYYPGIRSIPDNSYLNGYWQSEKYFQEISEVVREAFTFATPLSEDNMQIAREMSSCDSVSVHIRRGDYISNPSSNPIHSSCSLEYYRQAATEMHHRLGDVHFFVFSDDPEWVRKNILLPARCTYIDHNLGAASYCDMQLMSLCKNNIIANSSFSWWGAWLNNTPGKLVIAPKHWFRSSHIDVRDLYCNDWVLL